VPTSSERESLEEYQQVREGKKVHIMGSKLRDLVATLLVIAIGIPYVGYLVRGEMPFIQDPRGMAATGLVLGLVAFFVAARGVPEQLSTTVTAVSVVSLLLGVAALAFAEAAAAEVLLAVFMASILLAWALAMSRYVLGARAGRRGSLSHT
jgi:lysylphosphatidylglycerol synthetase-like protein (DUF2156 family)